MGLSRSQHVKRLLMRSIMEGQFGYADHIPSIASLAAFLDVSVPTVQEAVHMLAREGLLEPVPGKGLLLKGFTFQNTSSRKVGLVFPRREEYLAERPYPAEVIAAMRSELAKVGYELVPCPLTEMEELAIARKLQPLDLAGLILFELTADFLFPEIQELRLPTVSADHDAYRFGLSSVVFDNRFGSFQATQHLIAKGHRRISFIRPLSRTRVGLHLALDPIVAERMQGYQLAMQNAGLPVQVTEFEQTYKLMRHKLQEVVSGSQEMPTAFVCPGDHIAAAVIAEMQASGVQVPEDLSVIGFGETGVEFAPGRRVSSVWVDREAMGKTAARMLLATMRGGPQRTQLKIVPAKLVAYDSVSSLAPVVKASVVP